MSRWNSHSHEEEEVDFDQLLAQHPSTLTLLALPNFLEQVKSRSSKFTQKIVQAKHRGVLSDLIEIALTPHGFMESRSAVVDRAATHSAIEILSNLSEEFIEEVFDRHSEEEDAVVQADREYPILNLLFRLLATPSAEETALAYFNKLVTPFVYQRSEEMIRLATSQLLPQLVGYFWSQSVADVIGKLLEAENEKEFFEEEKAELIVGLCSSLAQEKNEEKVCLNAESFAAFVESLVEKHQDKYEKAKYAKLITRLLEHSDAFLFLFAQFDANLQHHAIRLHTLHALEAFLRIHLPAANHSKLSHQSDAADSFQLKPVFAEALTKWLGTHMIHEFVSDSRLELLAYYKLIKTALVVNTGLLEIVITQGFLTETLQLMFRDPNNNILHNYQREVLLLGICQSAEVCRLMQDELGLEQLFRNSVSHYNSSSSYENQLFLIGEAIREQSVKSQLLSEGWSQLAGVIDAKRQFYSAVIGGNPRGGEDKWDSMENENDMILRSLNQREDGEGERQTIEERLEVEVELPDKKIMIQLASGLDDLGGTEVLSEEEDDPFATRPTDDVNNKHFFDFELPLDSDKEESDPQNRSNSLEDISLLIKIESAQEVIRLSGSLGTSKCQDVRSSKEGELTVMVEDPLIEQTTQIVIEESFKEEDPSNRLIYYCREEVERALTAKYALSLKPTIALPIKEEIERSLLAKYGINLLSHSVKSTLNATKYVEEQIESLLICKYSLKLRK